jgi:hypothetical protein
MASQQQLVMAVHHVATPTAKVGGLGSGPGHVQRTVPPGMPPRHLTQMRSLGTS